MVNFPFLLHENLLSAPLELFFPCFATFDLNVSVTLGLEGYKQVIERPLCNTSTSEIFPQVSSENQLDAIPFHVQLSLLCSHWSPAGVAAMQIGKVRWKKVLAWAHVSLSFVPCYIKLYMLKSHVEKKIRAFNPFLWHVNISMLCFCRVSQSLLPIKLLLLRLMTHEKYIHSTPSCSFDCLYCQKRPFCFRLITVLLGFLF